MMSEDARSMSTSTIYWTPSRVMVICLVILLVFFITAIFRPCPGRGCRRVGYRRRDGRLYRFLFVMLLFFEVGLFGDPGGFVVAGMAPSGRHDDIQQFVLDTRRFYEIFPQRIEFPEINVPETVGVHFPCNAVLDLHIPFLGLEGAKHLIPDIEQVAEVGIHVKRVFRVVHAVMGGGKDDPVEEAQPSVGNDIFPYMDECAPGAVDEHNKEQ
mgnify:CR=1 FL=1